MSILQIELKADNLPLGDIPISTRILHSDFSLERKLSIRESDSVDLPSGRYYVQATLPSGKTVMTSALVGDNPTTVTLQLPESKHEWLAWQYFLGEVPDPVAQRTPQLAGHRFAPSLFSLNQFEKIRTLYTQGRRPEQLSDLFDGIWMRLWRKRERGYILTEKERYEIYPSGGPPEDDLRSYQLIPRIRESLFYLQIGGKFMPARFIVLPTTGNQVSILIRLSRLPNIQNGGLTVKVVTEDHDFETLSHYIRSGSYEAAKEIGGNLADRAEDMLQAKLQNPMGAVVAGYYLLRLGELDRMHNWANNFANWIRWLPDSAIIHAWQLIYGGKSDDQEQAKNRLVEAAIRGMPIFTEGLRLLVDGLEHFNPSKEGQVNNALNFVRRYAQATDWNQRTMTFYGSDPAKPSNEIVRGYPNDLTGVHKF